MTSQVYEEDQVLNDYLLFHYGTGEQILTPDLPVDWALDFPARCITESIPVNFNAQYALDIGCSVGRSTFEMSKYCQKVVGIDFSHNFINAAKKIQECGKHDILIKDHGNITSHSCVKLPSDVNKERIEFLQGDACNLPEPENSWDLVLAANLLCRLPSPRKFLHDISSQIGKNGLLILVSPYTWMEEYTPKSEWIGGTSESGDSSLAIKEILNPNFSLIQEKEIPFLIREHKRKFQLSTSHATVWQKV